MLRKLLLYLSGAGWARRLTTQLFLARRVALRFVAGETLDDAVAATRTLNRAGLAVSLDYLGESVLHADDTKAVVDTYHTLIERISADRLDASISLKLTHLGLDISEELCLLNLRHILTNAKDADIPVTIDMEGSDYTEQTLRLYRTVRDEYDFGNVGTVIQSALKRSRDDMRQLADEGARIRLCKGAYLEPPHIAYADKADVDKNYAEIMEDYLQHAPRSRLEIATHDEKLIKRAEHLIGSLRVPVDGYEFQMLYGVRGARQAELAAAGYPTRVYVPFGEAWYPYFMRRLAERPANLWFFLRSLLRR